MCGVLMDTLNELRIHIPRIVPTEFDMAHGPARDDDTCRCGARFHSYRALRDHAA